MEDPLGWMEDMEEDGEVREATGEDMEVDGEEIVDMEHKAREVMEEVGVDGMEGTGEVMEVDMGEAEEGEEKWEEEAREEEDVELLTKLYGRLKDRRMTLWTNLPSEFRAWRDLNFEWD